MRVWVDLTNSPHVLVLRPIVAALRAQGHEVQLTARDFAQTLGLLERFGIEHTVVGRHRGGRAGGEGGWGSSRARRRSRAGRAGARFDLALGHGSNDVTVAARLLRIPCATMFDYEWATVQHNVNCRLAQTVVVPRRDPARAPRALRRERQDRRLRGPQGGVLPRRLRARPGGARRARARPGRADRRRPHAARGVAVPPLRERRPRRGARAPARHADRRPAAHAAAARGAARRRLHRARAGDRRAVADRLRRPRRVRRRDDEPRGRRARHAGLDDVPGPPRRGRRARSSPRAGCACSSAPRTSSSPSAPGARAARARAARSGAAGGAARAPARRALHALRRCRRAVARSRRTIRGDAPTDPFGGPAPPPPFAAPGRGRRGAGRARVLAGLPAALRRPRGRPAALRGPLRRDDRPGRRRLARDLRRVGLYAKWWRYVTQRDYSAIVQAVVLAALALVAATSRSSSRSRSPRRRARPRSRAVRRARAAPAADADVRRRRALPARDRLRAPAARLPRSARTRAAC